MRIIPAIDLINGQCVRLSQGNYLSKKVYHNNPIEMAKAFEAAGLKFLHLVDLDGAKAKRPINHKILETISRETNLTVDFGGGIRTEKDIELAFSCGAAQITLGSIAVKNPKLVEWSIKHCGAEKIILGADCYNRKIAISGWEDKTAIDVDDFIRHYEALGIEYVLCTDVAQDGMLNGPSFDLYKNLMEQTQVHLIASGGVSSIKDVLDLQAMGIASVIIGKAIYEGNISLQEISSLC